MKLFVSYARVDTPLCKQIVSALSDVHEVWYDKRLFAGQDWWQTITRQLHACEGFVYVLSPESLTSEYCQKEFQIARELGKAIIPVLIQAKTTIPKELSIFHYADLSSGMEFMYQVLNAITLAERELLQKHSTPARRVDEAQPAPHVDPNQGLADATAAMETGDYDKALFILQQMQDGRPLPRILAGMVADLVRQATEDLACQTYEREAAFEYAPLKILIQSPKTRAQGCAALAGFHQEFPDYDPDNLKALCISQSAPKPTTKPAIATPPPKPALSKTIRSVEDILPQPFEWIQIPAGKVILEDSMGKHEVPSFYIAGYPITNAQFQVFVEQGYQDKKWWDFSEPAQQWRKENPKPEATAFDADLMPRTRVCWYEAMAFTNWLTAQTGQDIRLPLETQWQRAAQGDKGLKYPWGMDWDKTRCNTSESGIQKNTPVNHFPNGASPYGVMDMAGNVWEWCLNEYSTVNIDISNGNKRTIRGGSWFDDQDYARAADRLSFVPSRRLNVFGFRLVCVSPII